MKNLIGEDRNKPGQPRIPEIGGLALVLGFFAGGLTAIGFQHFSSILSGVSFTFISACLLTVFLLALIGFLDDFVGISQLSKAVLPLFASFPVALMKPGHTTMRIPFIGSVNFGVIYSLVFIPLGFSGAANAVNILAGFNGLELGMGLVAMISLAVVAYSLQANTAFIILISGIGALGGAIYYNWYPAKVMIGDVGTFTIGAILASAVIIGNFELAGVLIIFPYLVDFLIKIANGLPSEGWWGIYQDGKLYCSNSGPVGLCQLIMKISGGISERALVLILIGLESLFGLLAILTFAKLG